MAFDISKLIGSATSSSLNFPIIGQIIANPVFVAVFMVFVFLAILMFTLEDEIVVSWRPLLVMILSAVGVVFLHDSVLMNDKKTGEFEARAEQLIDGIHGEGEIKPTANWEDDTKKDNSAAADDNVDDFESLFYQ